MAGTIYATPDQKTIRDNLTNLIVDQHFHIKTAVECFPGQENIELQENYNTVRVYKNNAVLAENINYIRVPDKNIILLEPVSTFESIVVVGSSVITLEII